TAALRLRLAAVDRGIGEFGDKRPVFAPHFDLGLRHLAVEARWRPGHEIERLFGLSLFLQHPLGRALLGLDHLGATLIASRDRNAVTDVVDDDLADAIRRDLTGDLAVELIGVLPAVAAL